MPLTDVKIQELTNSAAPRSSLDLLHDLCTSLSNTGTNSSCPWLPHWHCDRTRGKHWPGYKVLSPVTPVTLHNIAVVSLVPATRSALQHACRRCLGRFRFLSLDHHRGWYHRSECDELVAALRVVRALVLWYCGRVGEWKHGSWWRRLLCSALDRDVSVSRCPENARQGEFVDLCHDV